MRTLLALLLASITPAEAGVIVYTGPEGTILIVRTAPPQRVETGVVLVATQPASDPVPWGQCNDPLGLAHVDIGPPVLESGYLFYEDPMDIVLVPNNIARSFTCAMYKGSTKLLEIPVVIQ